MPARVPLPLERLRPALALFLVATVLSGPAVAWQKGQAIEGRATAKDGDGIVIRGTEIRMQGVAAPEDNGYRVDPGGPEATRALSSLVDGEVVTCPLDGSRPAVAPSADFPTASASSCASLLRMSVIAAHTLGK